MSKIGILVCGNSGIDYIDHKYDISVMRSILFIGDKEYFDYVDIQAEEFYKTLLDNPSLTPSTAQAATGVIMEQYQEMFDKGYDELLVITVSQKLSGTFEGAVMAANTFNEKITVFDSGTVSYPEAKMALNAAKMAKEGKTIDQILERLEALKKNHRILFSVETLRYLVKNGRLSGASGFVGSMLKIKPMLEITDDGRIQSIEKIRTLPKATNRIIEKFLEELGNQDVEVFLINANADERIEFVSNKIKEARPDIKEIVAYPLTPVVGAHAGPGCVGVGYIIK